MRVAKLQVDFQLHGCRSLKDKRKRLLKLRDKFGRSPAIAVCESGYADDLRLSQWSFVACAGTANVVEQALADVERYLVQSVDAEITGLHRDWIA